MLNESHISIFVKNMRIKLRIGLEDFEKTAPQAVDVTLELFAAPSYLDDDEIIDYAEIYNTVKAWEERTHVELIETYLKELIALGFSFEDVTALRASITKPDIFDEADAAGLSVLLKREDYKP